MRRFLVVACASIALLARAAAAHDTWLLPATDRVEPNGAITLALTSGMAFPANESAIDPARIESARLRVSRQVIDLKTDKASSGALMFSVIPTHAGLGTLWVELLPRTLELEPSDVREYLAEIGAPADVTRRWEASPPPHRWRESYRKHTKTFVVVGAPAGDATWSVPVGMALELVPGKDPAGLKKGDVLTVRLLRNGQPAAGLGVGLVGEGSKDAVLRTTDASGQVSFDLTRSGRWLLRATDLRPSTEKDHDWDSDFATLTFSVH